MADEPCAKRLKSSDEFPNLRADVAGPVKEKLMELDAVQHQLDVMSEKAAEEILKVEQIFNKKRMPIYEKRKKLTVQIDHFWQTAFLNHHLLSTAIPEEQEDLLAALRDLEVLEFDDLRSGFKIVMKFDKNAYFENDVIIKSYHLQSESPSTEITEINWKENRKPAAPYFKKTDDGESAITFLEWLTYAAPPDSDEIAEVIKDDLYINPLQYYVMPDMQEVEDDDIEDFLGAERRLDENGRPIRPILPGDPVASPVTAKEGEAMEQDAPEPELEIEKDLDGPDDPDESAAAVQDEEDVDDEDEATDEAEGGEDEEEAEDEEEVDDEEEEDEDEEEEEEVEEHKAELAAGKVDTATNGEPKVEEAVKETKEEAKEESTV